MRLIKWSFLTCLLLANLSLFATEDVALLFKTKAKQEKQETYQSPKPELAPRECPTDQGMFITVDFLYWTALNQGFPWGSKNNLTTSNLPYGMEALHLDHEWDPGMRLGLGWDTTFDFWDVLVKWTYYHNHTKDSASTPDATLQGGGIFPLAGINSFNHYRNSKVQWLLNYNMFDLELGRTFFISKKLSLRPHIGGQGGWINQTFRVRYSQHIPDPTGAPVLDDESIYHSPNDYWGIGPRLGIDGNFHLGSGFSVFGNLATSLLFGIGGEGIPGTFFEALNAKNSFYELCPNLQMILGLSWGKCFNNEKTFFGLKAGWEANYWWNQYHLRSTAFQLPIQATKENHPLLLSGLTVNAKVDF